MSVIGGAVAASSGGEQLVLTAAEFGGFTGFNQVSVLEGTLVPDTYKGNTFSFIQTAGAGTFAVAFDQINIPQQIFSKMSITGLFVSGQATLIMETALATYQADDGNGRTQWALSPAVETMVEFEIYDVVIT